MKKQNSYKTKFLLTLGIMYKYKYKYKYICTETKRVFSLFPNNSI
jgi:hypothetical protein